LSKFFLLTKNKRICLLNYLFIYFIIIYSLIYIVDLLINIIYIHLYNLFILINNFLIKINLKILLLIMNKIFKYFCILKKKVFSLFFFDIYGLSKFFLLTKNKRICLLNYLFIYFIIIYSLTYIVDLFINIIYIHLYNLFILINNFLIKINPKILLLIMNKIFKYFCILKRKVFPLFFFWHIRFEQFFFY